MPGEWNDPLVTAIRKIHEAQESAMRKMFAEMAEYPVVCHITAEEDAALKAKYTELFNRGLDNLTQKP